MGWTRSELKEKAKQVLSQNYWKAVGVAFILSLVATMASGGSSSSSSASSITDTTYSLLSGNGFSDELGLALGVIWILLTISLVFSLAVSIFLKNPISVSGQRFFTLTCMGQSNFNEIAFCFKKGNYLKIVKTMFFEKLYIGLWSLLFIIPGIYKSYEYRMVPYILAENPDIDTNECLKLSKQLMDGEKMNAFVLDLSFIGWYVLSLFTCGILNFFYVLPYQYLTNAELYLTLRTKAFTRPSYTESYDNNYAAGSYTDPYAYNATDNTTTGSYTDPYATNADTQYPTQEGQQPYFGVDDNNNDNLN